MTQPFLAATAQPFLAAMAATAHRKKFARDSGVAQEAFLAD
jgi:hypothetical protein